MSRRGTSNKGPAEWRLKLFVMLSKELNEHRLVSITPGFKLNITDITPAQARISIEEPSEDDVKPCMITFRKFIAPNNATYIYDIFNCCEKHLKPNDTLLDFARGFRAQWKKITKTESIQLDFGGRRYDAEGIMDLWLNAHYFHDDYEKKRKLDSIREGIEPVARAQFLHYVYEGSRLIVLFGQFLEFCLTHRRFKFPEDEQDPGA